MSYTRHNWIDPETIDAAKLNNIEDGIEEAAQSGGGGGAKTPIVYCTIPFSGSRIFGRFLYVELSGGTYTALPWAASYENIIYALGVKYNAIWMCPFPVPEDDDKFLVFIPNDSSVVMSGNIASTPVTVGGEDAYIVHGDIYVSVT